MRETIPSKLDTLKKEQFAPETRQARIERALAALKVGPVLHLTAEQWKDAAENPEFEEEQ